MNCTIMAYDCMGGAKPVSSGVTAQLKLFYWEITLIKLPVFLNKECYIS